MMKEVPSPEHANHQTNYLSLENYNCQAIMAEGKQHALAIGFTKMSAKDISTINKGIGVDNMHYLNDGLWKMERLE
uniref:PUA domain-containing protein n=1 Tax=Aegilops tauschii subsp. strangulata TaxID=200361 RepID=A0A453GVS4_AEGTS